MSLLLLKLGLAAGAFAIGFAGASLPWLLARGPSSDRALSLGDTFAAGVLAGAGLVHLLGHGVDVFARVAPGLDYPVALALAGCGFFLILLVEDVIVADRPVIGELAEVVGPTGSRHEVGAGHHVARDRDAAPTPADAAAADRSAGALVLLLVLSLHSVILGLAVGSQAALGTALVIFAAVAAHKGLAGFAIGTGFLRAGAAWRPTAPGLAGFAVMTPTGIALGAVAASLVTGTHGQVVEAVFDSVAAGTLLYIASLDILSTEFDSPKDRGLKWLLAAAGFALMAALGGWI